MLAEKGLAGRPALPPGDSVRSAEDVQAHDRFDCHGGLLLRGLLVNRWLDHGRLHQQVPGGLAGARSTRPALLALEPHDAFVISGAVLGAGPIRVAGVAVRHEALAQEGHPRAHCADPQAVGSGEGPAIPGPGGWLGRLHDWRLARWVSADEHVEASLGHQRGDLELAQVAIHNIAQGALKCFRGSLRDCIPGASLRNAERLLDQRDRSGVLDAVNQEVDPHRAVAGLVTLGWRGVPRDVHMVLVGPRGIRVVPVEVRKPTGARAGLGDDLAIEDDVVNAKLLTHGPDGLGDHPAESIASRCVPGGNHQIGGKGPIGVVSHVRADRSRRPEGIELLDSRLDMGLPEAK